MGNNCFKFMSFRLNHLSDIEQCLESNVKQLEQTKEEKAAAQHRVAQLEAQLQRLAEEEEQEKSRPATSHVTDDNDLGNVDAEKQALKEQVKKLSFEVVSLQAQVEQLEKARDAQDREIVLQQKTEPAGDAEIVLQKNDEDGENEVVFQQRAENDDAKEMALQQKAEEDVQQRHEENCAETTVEANVAVLKLQVEELKAESSHLAEQKDLLEKEMVEVKCLAERAECEAQKVAEEKGALEKRVEELTQLLQQKQSELEETSSELDWQTKTGEEMQTRCDLLEAEVTLLQHCD